MELSRFFVMIEISNDPIFTAIIANPKKIKIDAINKYIAEAQGKEIMKRSPWVDIVVGPQSYQNLPELISKV